MFFSLVFVFHFYQIFFCSIYCAYVCENCVFLVAFVMRFVRFSSRFFFISLSLELYIFVSTSFSSDFYINTCCLKSESAITNGVCVRAFSYRVTHIAANFKKWTLPYTCNQHNNGSWTMWVEEEKKKVQRKPNLFFLLFSVFVRETARTKWKIRNKKT